MFMVVVKMTRPHQPLLMKETNMNLIEALSIHTEDIIAEAMKGVRRAHLEHYNVDDPETLAKLHKLLALCSECTEKRNVIPMVRYAQGIAKERFASGFGFAEVQTTYNTLEEAIWSVLSKKLPAEEFVNSIWLVSSILGMGKDAMARSYVELTSKKSVPSLNYDALFRNALG